MLGDNLENNNYGAITNEKSLYSKTFIWMFLGLLATGIISVFTYNQISNNLNEGLISLFPVMLIIELVVVFLFSLLFKKLPPTVVAILYFVYAAVNGVSLSTIFFIYEMNSIITVFFVSAAVYLVFALIGKYTNVDLSKIGTIALIGLLACIIISVINLFMGIQLMDFVIDWIVLLLFFGITAYDMQRIKVMIEQGILPDEKAHIYGAMQLYLDFINIFLRILRIFGKRR